jgi:hypothetical protein
MSAMQNQQDTQHHAARQTGHQTTVPDAAATPFTGLVCCRDCKSSRPMIIKALHPGVVSDTDRITYRCTACGAERTEPAK